MSHVSKLMSHVMQWSCNSDFFERTLTLDKHIVYKTVLVCRHCGFICQVWHLKEILLLIPSGASKQTSYCASFAFGNMLKLFLFTGGYDKTQKV